MLALVSTAALSWSPLSTGIGAISRARCGTRCAARTSIMAADWALLFDCDGVLADTERDGHRVGFNQVFSEDKLGFEWGVEEYGRLCEVGGGKERMAAYMNAKKLWPAEHMTRLPRKAAGLEQMEKGLPVDEGRLQLVTGLHKRKTAVFQELVKAGTVPLRPGILRLVDEAIAADVPLAVCSTSQEASVRTLVQTLMGEERYAKFEFFCGDVVPRKKPNPDVYNLASETMGYAAARCVVVEDSGIGLKAAKAAAMACCVTTSTYTTGEFDALDVRADLLVPELGEPGSDTCVTLADLRKLLD